MSFEALLAELENPDQSVRVSDLTSLSALHGEERERFLQAWRALSIQRRREVIDRLADLTEDNVDFDFTAVFFTGLLDDDVQVRAESIKALWEYESEDLVLESWTIPAGCVAALAASWHGRVGERTVVELTVRWKKGTTLSPDWLIGEGHVIEVAGRPTVRTTIQYLPPPDFEATTFAEFMVLGMIMTAMPAINAIP